MINEHELNIYFRDISKQLKCPHNQKKTFMEELKINVDEFLRVKQSVCMKDIYKEFGTPDEIACSFSELSESRKSNKTLIKLIVFFIACILVVYIVFVIVSLIDVHEEAHGYLQDGFLVIEAVWGRCFI